MATHTRRFAAPSPADRNFARDSARRLAPSLDGASGSVRLYVDGPNAPTESVTVPTAAFALLIKILQEMAKGNAVDVLNYEDEVTTGQMARLLNVSAPYAIKMLDDGKIQGRLVGTHRRARLVDVLAYRDEQYTARQAVLDHMSDMDQELGLI